MFTQNREQIRLVFIEVWQKYQNHLPLEPLETLILDVILLHPEYQAYLTKHSVAKEFFPEQGQTNPFLHMGLHLALREQVSTNRPSGIQTLYHQALAKGNNAHTLEHQMMECLMETLWQAQRYQTIPNETAYLNCLQLMLNAITLG